MQKYCVYPLNCPKKKKNYKAMVELFAGPLINILRFCGAQDVKKISRVIDLIYDIELLGKLSNRISTTVVCVCPLHFHKSMS